jgi:hypothetical protein
MGRRRRSCGLGQAVWVMSEVDEKKRKIGMGGKENVM